MIPGARAAKARTSPSYEWKAVTLLGLGFGLVGLDRWIIAPLLPSIAMDLGLSVEQQLNLVGVLGLVWGVFAFFSGMLSDRIGHRKILIPSILLFSVTAGLSGFATGFLSMLLIRGVMGLLEGSYCPTSFAATAAASAPRRRGFNQGLQQCGFALFGFGLGPIIATQLLLVVPSWRWVFLFSLGNVALITGPIATEAAPKGLISSAIGLVVASGEIFGGGVAPFLAGQIGGAAGIQSTLYMPLFGVSLGALVCLFLRETAPARRKMSRSSP